MTSIESRYMELIKTLKHTPIPKVYPVVSVILIIFILGTIFILTTVPWVQTAYGDGEVSTLDPMDRTQGISALISGQIQTWHVREGQKVKAGDPIVTLIDNDKELISRLENQLAAVEQQHQANLAAIEKTQVNLTRQKELLRQGLVSKRDVEAVEVNLENLKASAASTLGQISSVKISLSRQSVQTKRAPQDGTILRLMSAGPATLVSPGDVLASFIPEGVERAVVIKVSGLDGPLISEGRKVRLQFDGWPVFQFSGLPGVSLGTFGGVVDFVEPVADAQGLFNVWIKPDQADYPWPDESYVRLGSRVRAWVLLEEVKLGYELWRQLNNFPPKQGQVTNG